MHAMRVKSTFFFLVCFICLKSFSQQENSPYSRYGFGDQVPKTNIVNRGMGGIVAAYRDTFGLTINFNNPASFSGFISGREAKSKKQVAGRVLFDVGVNYDGHELRKPNSTEKYASGNVYFSHMQLGMPLNQIWGLSFGLRQLSRIDYKINRFERLYDPITNLPIDSSLTEFTGDGGSYLASIGTGVSIKNLSLGLNVGYLFGKKEYVVKRALINDTVDYNTSNHTTHTSFGNIVFTGGLQYKIDFQRGTSLRLGAYGNLKQNLNGSQDIIRETFTRTSNGDVRLDSVFEQKDIKGKIIYPASYGFGFILEKNADAKNKIFRTWLVGADFNLGQWDQYRFYGVKDSLTNSWDLRIGGQYRPEPKAGYFSNVAYRAGFHFGKDYIRVGKDLPLFGMSLGLGLPLPNYNRLAPFQSSIINLSFEYEKRGNNENVLKDNIFRISVGFSLSDVWFRKKQYE
jgi:hypothetical protein